MQWAAALCNQACSPTLAGCVVAAFCVVANPVADQLGDALAGEGSGGLLNFR